MQILIGLFVGWILMLIIIHFFIMMFDIFKAYPKTILSSLIFVFFTGSIIIFWQPLSIKVVKNYERSMRNYYSNETKRACIDSFKKQWYLAPAWKKNLPADTNVKVKIYKYKPHGTYIFMVPDVLKRNVNFWMESNPPHFKIDGAHLKVFDSVYVHFQKGQYIPPDVFDLPYKSVTCEPQVSFEGEIKKWEMYYVLIKGKSTKKMVKKKENIFIWNKNLGRWGHYFYKTDYTSLYSRYLWKKHDILGFKLEMLNHILLVRDIYQNMELVDEIKL